MGSAPAGTNADSHFNRSLLKMEQGSGAAPGTIRPLVRSFGWAGFFVWLIIGAVFATFFIGEYLDRPDHEKSFWKAGTTGIWCVGSFFWNRSRNNCFSFPHLQLNPGKVGTRLRLGTVV